MELAAMLASASGALHGSSNSSHSSHSSHSSSGGGSGADNAGDSRSVFVSFLLFLFNVGLIFGPHVGYVFQYLNIHTTGNIKGYSPVVSVILLVSNTIRVYYYPGAHYAKALLFQSLVAVLAHGVLLRKVLYVAGEQARQAEESRVLDYMSGVHVATAATTAARSRRQTPGVGQDPMLTAGGQPAGVLGGEGAMSYNIDLGGVGVGPAYTSVGGEHLTDGVIFATNDDEDGGGGGDRACVEIGVWRLSHFHHLYAACDAIETRVMSLEPQKFLTYYAAVGIAGFFSFLVAYAMTGFAPALVETVGYTALGIEATLLIPQLLRNARRRSTEGVTVALVFTWVGGDLVKVLYFFLAGQPLPFMFCGICQLLLDVILVRQHILFRQPELPHSLSALPYI